MITRVPDPAGWNRIQELEQQLAGIRRLAKAWVEDSADVMVAAWAGGQNLAEAALILGAINSMGKQILELLGDGPNEVGAS